MVQLEETTYQQLCLKERVQAAEILELKAQNEWLREQIRVAKHQRFAPSSEASLFTREPLLFDEAEVCAEPNAPEPDTKTVTYIRRRTPGQRDLDIENLERVETKYALPIEEQVCPECSNALHEIGEDVREEIEIIPARIVLHLHKCMKYACRHCQQNEITTPIVIAPKPKPAFPKSLASPTAVAHIVVQKFVEATPLYRLEESFRRLEFKLTRQNMANWMIKGAALLGPLYSRMKTLLLQRDILHADETRLQVLNEPGRDATATSFMWLYRTGRDGPPIVLYEYQPTRAAEHPKRFLTGFVGHLHADGYIGYEGIPGVILSGCWSHARRKFAEAITALPRPALKKGRTPAQIGLEFCNSLFDIERDLHDVTPDERLAGRQARSRQEMDKFRDWLDAMKPQLGGESKLAKAVNYCINQWDKLSVFLTDGRLELDNNRAERSIKPFVIGRKNWLFSNSTAGATSSAVLYSFVETTKENGLNPLTYLTYLFEQLPNIDIKDPKALDLLLPWAEPVQAKFRLASKPTK